jgi:hypothetical protein
VIIDLQSRTHMLRLDVCHLAVIQHVLVAGCGRVGH